MYKYELLDRIPELKFYAGISKYRSKWSFILNTKKPKSLDNLQINVRQFMDY